MKKYILTALVCSGTFYSHASESTLTAQFLIALATVSELLEEIDGEASTPSKLQGLSFFRPSQKEKLQKLEETLRELQNKHLEVVAQVNTLGGEKQRLEEHNKKQIEVFNALQQEHTNLQTQAQELETFSKKLQDTYKGDLESLQKIYEDYQSKLVASGNELNHHKENLKETFLKHLQEIDAHEQKFLKK